MFIENKYMRIYFRLIDRAKARILSGYVEKHHIIPRKIAAKSFQNLSSHDGMEIDAESFYVTLVNENGYSASR